jgi:hypothetical protein
MREYVLEGVKLQVLGNEIVCDLKREECGYFSKISPDIARRCYQKALQYLVFGGIPSDMRVSVSYGEHHLEVIVYHFFPDSSDSILVELKVSYLDECRLYLSSGCSRYLEGLSSLVIPFSIFTIQE